MPGVRDAAQPTRSGGRARCPLQSQPVTLIIQPAERVLFSDTRAPTRSRASNAQDWFESFTLIGSSESSRENSGKIFDLFSPPGPSWSPKSAPKAVLCSSARRAASSYPWPSPRRRIERFALGASRYTQIASLSTGEEFRCLSASANGPCARSSPSFSKVDECPRLARCCWKAV